MEKQAAFSTTLRTGQNLNTVIRAGHGSGTRNTEHGGGIMFTCNEREKCKKKNNCKRTKANVTLVNSAGIAANVLHAVRWKHNKLQSLLHSVEHFRKISLSFCEKTAAIVSNRDLAATLSPKTSEKKKKKKKKS